MSANPLRAGIPPRWATAWGEDEYGVFAAFTVKEIEHRMRWIPPGRFVMGSPQGEAGRRDDEGPQHEVVLTEGYWLGETLVTQALWTAVMGENPSRFKGEERPVEQVSWEDCQRFLERLSEKWLQRGARLPTEAEWERACRAETQTATWVGELTLSEDGIKAHELDAIAWYFGNAKDGTHAVAQKAANPFGLYDMLGNVWEWCADWYGPYDYAPAVNPTGPVTGTYRVLRGGSWNCFARLVRAASRYALDPGDRFGFIGFRLARGQG